MGKGIRASSRKFFSESIALKVIGRSADDFETFVVDIVRQHYPEVTAEAVAIRDSRDGHYMAVSVTITPKNKEQLDALYKDLVSHKRVIMVL